MAAAIQFYGSDTVVKAFEKRGLNDWAIFQQRQMCVSGSGSETLQEYLDMLQSNPVPVYTLKVYKGVDADDITDKTPCHGSFNFKLDADGAVAKTGNAGGGAWVAVMKRIEEMESGSVLDYLDRLEERRAKREGNSSKLEIIGAVNNLINDPASLVSVINGIKTLFSGGNVSRAVGTNSTRPPESQQATTAMPETENFESKIERMQAAINILDANDPDFVSHLEKLAKLSDDNKMLFEMMLKQLDGMYK